MTFIKNIIDYCLTQIPCEIEVLYNEPMKNHTTFKVGGPADCLVKIKGGDVPSFCALFLNRLKKEGIPFFILGGGANIVVSDRGIRGLVIDMSLWKSPSVINGEELILNSGTSIDEASEAALAAGLSGLEFLAGMPGTIGGAVWMNARCYGSEISDALNWTEILTTNESELNNYKIKRFYTNQVSGFGYKQSPFQIIDCLILSAGFNLKKGDKDKIKSEMEKNRQDRKNKGHYLFPCAGSVFKNNHNFGKPSGLIIDEIGLKGLKRGGAQVATFHGNIIINTGNANASDIRQLTEEVALKVKEKTGFSLEPEILFAGDWS